MEVEKRQTSQAKFSKDASSEIIRRGEESGRVYAIAGQEAYPEVFENTSPVMAGANKFSAVVRGPTKKGAAS